eukprot:TRINITY_DN1534_c0_g2_i1.p1 TRINITY_DN1534_c0_g2~~TRINITY_DN1534_c0_g2_i1.p1  ORF type:complete len:201 (+),score=36.28 TRINITY_DN1534_c0_g2_i1:62-604(+)
MKVKPSVLGGIVFLCNLALCSADDDDTCLDRRRNRWVRSRDCEHSCCVDNECGSSSECTAALVIGLIVGAVILCLCVGGCIALWYFCWRDGIRSQPQTIAVVTAQPVTGPAPMYGVPVDAHGNAVPQQYPPLSAPGPQGQVQCPPPQDQCTPAHSAEVYPPQGHQGHPPPQGQVQCTPAV